jgi:hypothetical protein
VAHIPALAVRNHDHAPGQETVTDDAALPVVPASVLNLERLPGEYSRGIQKVESAL